MESIISVINRMDIVCDFRIIFSTFVLSLLLMFISNPSAREIFSNWISILVWGLFVILMSIKKAKKEWTCSKGIKKFERKNKIIGRKRRARLDTADGDFRQETYCPKDSVAEIRADSTATGCLDTSETCNEKTECLDNIVEAIVDIIATVLPEVPELPKKSRRRQKKKKNRNKSKYKSMMDDSSETSSCSDLSTKIDTHPVEKTKIYTALPKFVELNRSMYSLYQEFKYYLLSEDELKANDFPKSSPHHPGRAVFEREGVKRGEAKRHCCRCLKSFYILPDGQYQAAEACVYHWKKRYAYRNRPHGGFPCCDGDYLSEGCRAWQYHVTQESVLEDVDFVKTKRKKHLNEETAGTVYALDCEMLYTTAGMEVAKVGIVGLDGLTIFESFVLPQNPILDYNTLYSGVTEKDLRDVNVTLPDVQAYLLKLLNKESILVGHGLENDLKALRLIHEKIVDTSVVFPHEYDKRRKKSLKQLAYQFLNKDIQNSENGHSCIEDARACMELMLHKISIDIKNRPPIFQDENKNSILQNSQPLDLNPNKFPFQFKFSQQVQSWPPYSCNYSYYNNNIKNNFYSDYLMPKNFQQNYIY